MRRSGPSGGRAGGPALDGRRAKKAFWRAGRRARGALVAALRDHPPNVLVSASAVGYYGSRGDEILTEQSPPASRFPGPSRGGVGARGAGGGKTRRARGSFADRNGAGPGGGALHQMLLPFQMGVGGRIGTGTQWMSWIHIEDSVQMILFALARIDAARRVERHLASPRDQCRVHAGPGRAVHRPAVIPVPAFALKLLLGEMSEILAGRPASRSRRPPYAPVLSFAIPKSARH